MSEYQETYANLFPSSSQAARQLDTALSNTIFSHIEKTLRPPNFHPKDPGGVEEVLRWMVENFNALEHYHKRLAALDLDVEEGAEHVQINALIQVVEEGKTGEEEDVRDQHDHYARLLKGLRTYWNPGTRRLALKPSLSEDDEIRESMFRFHDLSKLMHSP